MNTPDPRLDVLEASERICRERADEYLLASKQQQGYACEQCADDIARFASSLRTVSKRPPLDTGGTLPCGLTNDQLVQACSNVGFDLTCGGCAGAFFTGGYWNACDPTCKTMPKPDLGVVFTSETPPQ